MIFISNFVAMFPIFLQLLFSPSNSFLNQKNLIILIPTPLLFLSLFFFFLLTWLDPGMSKFINLIPAVEWSCFVVEPLRMFLLNPISGFSR